LSKKISKKLKNYYINFKSKKMAKIADKIILTFKEAANPQKAQHSQRFFKTAKGEYGEGDLFLGVTVPQVRSIVKQYQNQVKIEDLVELADLLIIHYHEVRLSALLLLLELFKGASTQTAKKQIVDFYLAHSAYVNSWDLVDLSADKILGQYLLETNQNKPLQQAPSLLINLAKSEMLWERRIAVLSTFAFIRAGEFLPTLKLAKILLNDQEDLIHKAVGWLLREVGKRDEKSLINFLDQYTLQMPRTMLRYAIEKLPENKRQFYLNKKY